MAKCCMCSLAIERTEPIHVGDLMGCRADDVVCSDECREECVWESHDSAWRDGEMCHCDVCRRVRKRVAHSAVARWGDGPRPAVELLGEVFPAVECDHGDPFEAAECAESKSA